MLGGLKLKGIVFFLIYTLVPLGIIIYLLKVEINYVFLAPAFALMLATYLAFGLKWKNLTSLAGNVRYAELVRIEASSKLVHLLSPFQLDVPVRAYLLKRRGISASHTVSMSVLDILTDMMLCLSVIILVSANAVRDPLVFSGLIGLLLVLIAFILRYPVNTFRKLEAKLRNRFLKKAAGFLVMMPESMKLLLKNPRRIAFHLVALLLVWACRWGRVYLIFLALGAVVPIEMIMLAFCASSVAVFVTRIPSGIVVTEATALVILSGLADPAVVLSAFLIDRLFTVITAVGVGSRLITGEMGGVSRHLWNSMKGK